MSGRGQVALRRVYLLFILSGFWLVASLIITLFPLRAHALVPELFDSAKSTFKSLDNETKKIPGLPRVPIPNDDNSSGGGSKSGKGGTVSSSGTSSSTSNNTASSGSGTTSKPATTPLATYPTLSLATKPLGATPLPTTTLASAETHTGTSGVAVSDGKPRLVLLEPSDEGWRVLGIAWYWWLAAAILFAAGGIAMREFRRISKVKETWA